MVEYVRPTDVTHARNNVRTFLACICIGHHLASQRSQPHKQKNFHASKDDQMDLNSTAFVLQKLRSKCIIKYFAHETKMNK